MKQSRRVRSPPLDSFADIILHPQHLPRDTSDVTGSQPVTLCIWHNRVLTLVVVVVAVLFVFFKQYLQTASRQVVALLLS